MSTFIAIDSGGTNTRCWVASESRVLGSASCGTVKTMVVGERIATERLQQLVREAALDAGIDLAQITRTCLGLGGIGSGHVKSWAETTLAEIVSGEVLVVGDEDIALEAAFKGGPGIFLIAGTGSIVIGRSSNGNKFGAGGFGPVLGDEGSGGWIGIEAVRSAFKAIDRNQKTILLDEVMRFWKLGSIANLIAKGNDSVIAPFAELSGLVAECAANGDAVAIDVLQRAGEQLAEIVLLAVDKMRAAGCPEQDTMQLAYTGSALGKISIVRESMTRRLHHEFPEMKVATEEVNALEGALWLAQREAPVA